MKIGTQAPIDIIITLVKFLELLKSGSKDMRSYIRKKTTDNGKRLDSEDTRFLADSFYFAQTFFCFLVKQKIENLYPLLRSHEEVVLRSKMSQHDRYEN